RTSTAELVAELEALPAGRTRKALYARLGWSYQYLSAELQLVLRLLGAHPGRVLTAGTAAAVLDRDLSEALDLLDALVTAGMAQRHRGGVTQLGGAGSDSEALVEARRDLYAYTAHDVILDYAVQLAHQHPDERHAYRTRLLEHYQARIDGYTPEDDLAWLTHEYPHITALALTGHDAAHARLATDLGDLLHRTGRYAAAETLHHHAATTYQAIGDRLGEAGAQWGLAAVARAQGRYEEARGVYERAAATFQ